MQGREADSPSESPILASASQSIQAYRRAGGKSAPAVVGGMACYHRQRRGQASALWVADPMWYIMDLNEMGGKEFWSITDAPIPFHTCTSGDVVFRKAADATNEAVAFQASEEPDAASADDAMLQRPSTTPVVVRRMVHAHLEVAGLCSQRLITVSCSRGSSLHPTPDVIYSFS